MTERLHFHFSFSCIGEGNGNPLQYSCLENPGDEGAWWAAVYGVAQSQTWLKQLSSCISFIDMELSIYFISFWISFGDLCFKRICPFHWSCQIHDPKVVQDIHYPFILFYSVNDVTSFNYVRNWSILFLFLWSF